MYNLCTKICSLRNMSWNIKVIACKYLVLDTNTWIDVTVCRWFVYIETLTYSICTAKTSTNTIYLCIFIYVLVLYNHEQLYIRICMQKHNDAIKTSGHSSLEKYTSQFIWKFERVTKGLLCERWGGDWTELQHIDPHSSGYNSISFPFSWAAQPGSGGLASAWTRFSFQHLLSNWFELPVAGVI